GDATAGQPGGRAGPQTRTGRPEAPGGRSIRGGGGGRSPGSARGCPPRGRAPPARQQVERDSPTVFFLAEQVAASVPSRQACHHGFTLVLLAAPNDDCGVDRTAQPGPRPYRRR